MRVLVLIAVAAAALALVAAGLGLGGGHALGGRSQGVPLGIILICAISLSLPAVFSRYAGTKRPRITGRVVRLWVFGALSFLLAATVATFVIPPHSAQRAILDLVLFVPGYVFLILAVICSLRHGPRKGRCTVCEYDLTGNVSGRCPECGTPIDAERGSEGA